MEGQEDISKQIATIDSKQNNIISHEESFTQESSQSESNREEGNTKIREKSANFQSQGTAQIVQKTGTGTVSTVVQSSFTSSKDVSGLNESELNPGNEKEETVKDSQSINDLIKSFEEKQKTPPPGSRKLDVEIVPKQTVHAPSLKTLQLLNRYIDVPDSETETNKENIQPTNIAMQNKPEEVDAQVNELSQELEELRKEEERCEKIYVTRETSTTSLEEAFIQRLQERQYKNIQDMLNDSLPSHAFNKVKRPESLPPGNLVHLLQSVQIAQELNRLIKQPNEENKNTGGQGVSLSLNGSYVNLVIRKFNQQENRFPIPIQKSASASGIIESNRGFKPSDVYDPCKKEFLTSLSRKLLHIGRDENSGNVNKPIDLEKLFTPATDSGEVTPMKNRKMYSSSSFYSPFHPTVQDQIELARRISSSLCDISNKQSKGQSMYVNRMKRSVKWVHGGEAQNESQENTYTNEEYSNCKIPNPGLNSADNLKLVMNPHGKVQDLSSLTKQGVVIQSPLSPEICFDLVRDLNTKKGRGAELFAKRRKKSEKWVVDENTVRQSNTFQRQTSQSNAERVLNLSNQQREQQMQKIHEIKERFNQPKLKLIKSPWEAALETGSVDTAFQELQSDFTYPEPYVPWTSKLSETGARGDQNKLMNYKNDLYMPNIPKGWNSSGYGGASAGVSNPLPLAPNQIPPYVPNDPCNFGPTTKYQPKTWDFNSWNNYNTAPRGWKHDLDYYRPVTFTSHKLG